MASDEEKATWEAKLVGKKYFIKGIKTQNDAMMKAVYDTLGISEDDFPTQSQVNAFIEERQGQPRPGQEEGEKCFRFGSLVHLLLNLFKSFLPNN